MATIVLSPNQKVAMVGSIELKVSDVIDYVSTEHVPNRMRTGVIDKFWLADPKGMRAVWATVRDLNGEGNDCISLANWKQYLDEGVIKN